jgi:small subunit ribosomal protein S14
MAKESMKAKERKRAKLAARYENKRKELREAANKGNWDAMMALQKLPKNSMSIRKHNRCQLTGRPRGYMRQFGISRVTFREMALAGKIPGVKKSSW